MNEIINNNSKPEFSHRYLQWLYSLTIVILVFIFIFQSQVRQSYRTNDSVLIPPYIIAAGQVVEYGIDEFRTSEIQPITSNRRIKTLISLLLYFVIAPTLVILLFPTLNKEKHSDEKKNSFMNPVHPLLFLFGLFICLSIVVSTAIGTYRTPRVFDLMKSDNLISDESDMLTSDLGDTYSGIIQYYYQTEKYGGKNTNIIQRNKNGTVSTVQSLSAFRIPEKTKSGTLFLQPTISDTMVVVYAIGNSALKNNSFKNANGETGKTQYAAEISLLKPSYKIQKNN